MIWLEFSKSGFQNTKLTIDKNKELPEVSNAVTRKTVTVAYCCQKTKNVICGMEGENVVAYGSLPSPSKHTNYRTKNITLI